MSQDITKVVMSVLEEVNKERENPLDLAQGEKLVLYGASGAFDSMGLVNFLGSLEEELEDTTGESISLTSEKAVSRRVSPFSSVRALVDFIKEELAAVSEAA